MPRTDEKSTVAKTAKTAKTNKKRSARKTTARKTASSKTPRVKKKTIRKAAPRKAEVPAGERQSKIAAVAFRISRTRGFEPGHEFEDWLAAEAEVDGRVLTG